MRIESAYLAENISSLFVMFFFINSRIWQLHKSVVISEYTKNIMSVQFVFMFSVVMLFVYKKKLFYFMLIFTVYFLI